MGFFSIECSPLALLLGLAYFFAHLLSFGISLPIVHYQLLVRSDTYNPKENLNPKDQLMDTIRKCDILYEEAHEMMVQIPNLKKNWCMD